MKKAGSITDQSLRKNKFFLSIVVAVYVLLLSSFVASAEIKNNIQSPSQNPEVFVYVSPGTVISGDFVVFAKSEPIIYVSSNTVIYGQENFSKVESATALDLVAEKNRFSIQKTVGISQEFVVFNKSAEKSVKQLQESLNKEVENTFYTSKNNHRNFEWAEIILSKQISFHCSGAANGVKIVTDSEGNPRFTKKITKHNFYSSLCYLEFPKLRNVLLRGPPTI